MKRILIAALAVWTISTAQAATFDEEQAYVRGQHDGCDMGKKASGAWINANKDIDAYVKDRYYKVGYDEGFIQCKSEGDRINQIINDNIRW